MSGNPGAFVQSYEEASKIMTMKGNEDTLYYGDLGFGLDHDYLRFLDIKVIKCPLNAYQVMILYITLGMKSQI